MEKTNIPAFEQVNAAVEHFDATKQPVKTGAKVSVNDLKNVWSVAKPILLMVGSLSILPTKWRNTITHLIEVIDAVATVGV